MKAPHGRLTVRGSIIGTWQEGAASGLGIRLIGRGGLDKGLQLLAVGDDTVDGGEIVPRHVIYVGLSKQSPTYIFNIIHPAYAYAALVLDVPFAFQV